MKKVEDKNSIKSYFSDTASMTTKSTSFSYKGWSTTKGAPPTPSSSKYSNVKSRYAASCMLDSSNKAANHSKKPSIFDYDAKIDEKDEEDHVEKGQDDSLLNVPESSEANTATMKQSVA